MAKKGHASGSKIAKRHTTLIGTAEKIVKKIRREPSVQNIVIGIIKTTKGRSTHRITVKDVDSGLKVTVRMPRSVQTLFVVTTDRSRIARIISRL